MKTLLALLLILALLAVGFAVTITADECDPDTEDCLIQQCPRDVNGECTCTLGNDFCAGQPTPAKPTRTPEATGGGQAPPGATIRIPKFSFHDLIPR